MSRPGEFKSFQVEEDRLNGGYRVVFWVTCYAHSFGDAAYPPQLAEFAGTGNTSFMILAKDDEGRYFEGLEYEEALEFADRFDNDFSNRINDCEESADWSLWPAELAYDVDDVVFYR